MFYSEPILSNHNNNINDTENNVKVFCRFRPLNQEELFQSTRNKYKDNCVHFIDDQTVEIEDGSSKKFLMDKVFNPLTTQGEVFEATMQPLINQLIEGYNVTCIAYGQTGSGKSYTMLGPTFANPKHLENLLKKESLDLLKVLKLDNENYYSKETYNFERAFEFKDDIEMNSADLEESLEEYSSGIIQRSVFELFASLSKRPDIDSATIACSYIEIYNEKIQDLLYLPPPPGAVKKNEKNEKPKLTILSSGGIVVVRGATSVSIQNPNHLLRLMQIGSKNRAIGQTHSNHESSRSHAIFIVTLQLENTNNEMISSQLYLVDLAGSEKVEKTGASGRRLTEAANINKSLLSLGNVISSLAKSSMNNGKAFPISYRSSKLTHLLQNSFGGNSKTCVICTATTSQYNLPETLSTLRFAKRAATIRNQAVSNVMKIPSIHALMAENKALKHQLMMKQMEIDQLLLSALRSPMSPQRRKTISHSLYSRNDDDEEEGDGEDGDEDGNVSMLDSLDLSGHLPLPIHHHHHDVASPIVSSPNIHFDNNNNNISNRGGSGNGGVKSNKLKSNLSTNNIERTNDSFNNNNKNNNSSGSASSGGSGGQSKALEKAISNNNNNNNYNSYWKDLSCFICPLTNNIMNTPVVAADGYSYDKDAFLRWTKFHSTSPVLGTPLPSLSYYHNLNLQRQLWIRHIQSIHYFDTIPYEVLFIIFSYLDSMSLFACANVCSTFRMVATDELLWKRLLFSDFGIELDRERRVVSGHHFKSSVGMVESGIVQCDLRQFYVSLKMKSKFRNASLSLTHNLILGSPIKK